MKNLNTLNTSIRTYGLDTYHTMEIHNHFINLKTYEWWYKTLPGDIVVDLGASVGPFSCHALDSGADAVYVVEPNVDLLKNAIFNVSPYMYTDAPNKPKLHFINKAIGNSPTRADHVFQSQMFPFRRNIDVISWDKFIEENEIEHIDFLKVNIQGAEYDIFTKERLEFFKTKVRHMAIMMYLDNEDRLYAGQNMADTFLKHFLPTGEENKTDLMHQKVRTQNWNVFEELMYGNGVRGIAQGMTGPKILPVYITNW